VKDRCIAMDPVCPRCGGRHGVDVSGDGNEWDCATCGGHLICAIGDIGAMYPYHREDGSCGCASEPHTCDLDDEERAELLVEAESPSPTHERRAVVSFLLDRVEQYSNSSGYRALFDELIGDIAEGRHVQCWTAGEYDDLARRVDRIMSRRSK
jgi:hypothetical protein